MEYSLTDELTPPQQAALEYVAQEARRRQSEALGELDRAFKAASVSEATRVAALQRLRREARVAIAFHPDRETGAGHTVGEGLLRDGVYRNQFETGLSSGSTNAHSGGRRDEWERLLFGGAYHVSRASWADRPKYGALFLADHPDGPCPRFGSAYLVLRQEVTRRCSFTTLGSHHDDAPESTGTLDILEPVFRSLARHVETFPAPLGVESLSIRDLFEGMSRRIPIRTTRSPDDPNGRALDTFVEAHVHGRVDVARDVETLVVDSSFRGTTTADILDRLCATYGVALNWHPGFELQAEEFPDEFRGFPVRPIAERVATEGVVDASALGTGEKLILARPEEWQGLGSRSDALTSFRRAWHVLVLLGRPSRRWVRTPDR